MGFNLRTTGFNLPDHFVILVDFQVLKCVATLYFSLKRWSDAHSHPDLVVLVRPLQTPHFSLFAGSLSAASNK